ncbi:MAG: hypothetical protein KAG99_07730, partial [Bacteroidales bacterium]|nr:hypothetical protein [Bacteroidales bacterium]
VTGPPPDQPWVIYDSHQIDDSQGNNNGEVDFGETILLNFTMKNIGDQPATAVSVTLSTENYFVTLTDDSENFGDMAVEELKNIDGAFSFEVSDSIPNGTSISFIVTAMDANDSTFISGFAVQANAPELAIGYLTVVDLEGNNNGRLDPGETADIFITTSNPGAFDANNTMATLSTSSQDVTLNTSSFELNTIEAGGASQAVFNLTVNDEAMIGSAVDLNYYVSSDYQFAEKMFIEKIGLILEDYETGDFSGFNWMFGGNTAWEITSDEAYEGMYSAKSGAIGDQSTSELYIEYDVMFDDSISFFRKVSSEPGYDYLEFYIDETLIEAWAGEEDWARKAYAVSAGPHTFSWVYSKDYSVANGDDCGWIDYVIFPPELRTTAYDGADDVTCETTTYQLNGNATNFESLLWTTTGSGVFDDASVLNPVYTPSDDDLAAGSVELTITVYGPTETISDGMILSITMNPVAFAGDDATICEGEDFTVTTASAENYTELLWATT